MTIAVDDGSASVLTASSRIEATRRASAPALHYTWARNSDAEIVAMDDHSNLGGDWINYGKPNGVNVNANGISATSYSGTPWMTHIFYVGTNGTLYEGVKAGTGTITWTPLGSPTGETLTGHIAAGNFLLDALGTRMVAVVASTSDGDLYRWGRVVTDPNGAWINVSGGRSWNTDTPLAATTSASESTISFFGTIADNDTSGWELGMVRYASPGPWTTTDQGNPVGLSVCDSLSAAQGQLSASVYRLYVVCSAMTASSSIAFAYGTSESDSVLAWDTRTLSSTVPTTRGNVVAATVRPDGSGSALDLYILTSDNHHHRVSRTGLSLQSTVDLGLLEEASAGYGGMTAAATTDDYSRLLLLARIDDPWDSDAYYLYERSGRAYFGPREYQNYGAGSARKNVVGQTHAEGVVAEYQGTLSVALINRPGTDGPNGTNFPRVRAFRSHDDADIFPLFEELNNTVGAKTYNYVVDPTVAVTDQDLTYVFQLGVERSTCYGSATSGAAYLMHHGQSGTTWTPISVRTKTNGAGFTGTPIDHPYVDIQHRAGLADRLHMAWVMTESPAKIEYATLNEGSGPSLPTDLTITTNVVGPPRVAANDLGDVYIYTNVGAEIYVCKVGQLDGTPICEGNWSDATDDATSTVQFDPTDTPAQGNSVMRTLTGYSLAASPTTPGVVHLCFQRKETNGGPGDPHKDIACLRGSWANGSWVWPQNATAVGPQNDDRDQFMPEVSMTADNFTWETNIADEGQVFVWWYDRYNDPQNITYRVRASTSDDGGASWYAAKLIFGGDSDPANLPRHCKDPTTLRFIGDYSGTRASTLHTHFLYVTAPGPGIGTSVNTTFRSFGNWRE